MKLFIHRSLSIIVLTVLLLTSCKDDLELNAPYKEIPTIYAVLNPQEPIQVIRINKVFLGEGDANQMAKVADSVNYKPGEISVSLKHSDPSKSVVVFHDSVISTAGGAFSTTQRVYVSAQKLEVSGVYTLTVKNNHTGNVFTATTTAIDKISENQFSSLFDKNYSYPYRPGTEPKFYIDYSNLTQKAPYDVRFNISPYEGKVFQLIIRMHFYEMSAVGQTTYNFVDYVGGNRPYKDKTSLNGVDFIVTTFKAADIFNAAGVGLSKMGLSNNVTGRKMYKIEYLVYSSTQDYIDYLQFAAPSLSISQDKPLYSNFKDKTAIGIFTFRTVYSISKAMDPAFVSAFSGNPSTCRYKFMTTSKDSTGQGWCN